MPPLLYDPPELTEHAARVDLAHVRMARLRAATGSDTDAATRRISGAGMRGRAALASPAFPSYQGLMMTTTTTTAAAAAAVAPLKPRILYKRESELDRQTIPLQGVGWAM